jgi:hypothetical protein
MEFTQALNYLKHAPHTGAKITSTGWDGAGMLELAG